MIFQVKRLKNIPFSRLWCPSKTALLQLSLTF